MAMPAATGQVNDDKQQDQADDPKKHIQAPACASGRASVG